MTSSPHALSTSTKAPTVSFTFTPESSIKRKRLDKPYNYLYMFNTPYLHSHHKIIIFVHYLFSFNELRLLHREAMIVAVLWKQ